MPRRRGFRVAPPAIGGAAAGRGATPWASTVDLRPRKAPRMKHGGSGAGARPLPLRRLPPRTAARTPTTTASRAFSPALATSSAETPMRHLVSWPLSPRRGGAERRRAGGRLHWGRNLAWRSGGGAGAAWCSRRGGRGSALRSALEKDDARRFRGSRVFSPPS
jgi:hypothetical protein